MSNVDLKAFIETLHVELETHRLVWSSRIDAGAEPTKAMLWANGYTVRLDFTRNHIEPGSKFDQIRMVIFRDPRESISEATGFGESTELLETAIWRSVESEGEMRWKDEGGSELTIQQVLGVIRSEFCRIVETGT